MRRILSGACAALLCTLLSVSVAQARGFGGSPAAPLGGGVHQGVAVVGGHFGGRPVALAQHAPIRVEGLRVQHVPLPTDPGFGRALVNPAARVATHLEHAEHIEHLEHVERAERHEAHVEHHSPLPGAPAWGHHVASLPHSVAAARAFSVREAFHHRDMFDHRWYAAHPRAWWPAGWAERRPWLWTTWPALAIWLGWQTVVQPPYYDYGTNVVYVGNEVYYGGQPVATAVQYYQQSLRLAQSLPLVAPLPNDWTPLGVFALAEGSPSARDRVFQLAISRQGAVAGNFSDGTSGVTLPVQGAVDQASGRTAWTVGDNRTVVYETGIYNLTQEHTPVLVHFGSDTTQQSMLVRLQE